MFFISFLKKWSSREIRFYLHKELRAAEIRMGAMLISGMVSCMLWRSIIDRFRKHKWKQKSHPFRDLLLQTLSLVDVQIGSERNVRGKRRGKGGGVGPRWNGMGGGVGWEEAWDGRRSGIGRFHIRNVKKFVNESNFIKCRCFTRNPPCTVTHSVERFPMVLSFGIEGLT